MALDLAIFTQNRLCGIVESVRCDITHFINFIPCAITLCDVTKASKHGTNVVAAYVSPNNLKWKQVGFV